MDIETLFRAADDSLLTRLNDWMVHGDGPPHERKGGGKAPKLPARIVVRWRSIGSGSSEQIVDLPVKSLPATADALVEQLQTAVVDRLGTDPSGQITVRAHGQGASGSPGLNWTRTLGQVAAASDDLLRELREARHMVRRLHEHLAERAKTDQLTIAALTTSVHTLGTARTVGSASADMGTSIVSSVTLLVAVLPFLRRMLTRADSTALDPLSRQLAGAIGLELPAGAPDDFAGVLDALERDPALRLRLTDELGRRPELTAQLAEKIVPLMIGRELPTTTTTTTPDSAR